MFQENQKMSNGVNKKLLFILTGSILTLALLVFFAATGWDYFTQKEAGKCGDGICDEKEKANPNLCPGDCEEKPKGIKCPQIAQPPPQLKEQCEKDGGKLEPRKNEQNCIVGYECKKENSTTPSPSVMEEYLFSAMAISDSNFMTYSQTINILKDLKVNFINLHTTFIWSNIEPEKGEFDWEETDKKVNLAYENQMDLMPTIFPCRGVFDGNAGGYSSTYCVPKGSNIGIKDEDIEGYRNFIYQTVSRYKDKVKYWQLMEEASNQAKNDPEGYGKTLKITYEEIKKADSEAKIAIGQCPVLHTGEMNKAKMFFEKVFDEIDNGYYFDYFEILYTYIPDEDNNYTDIIKSVGKETRELLDQHGYSYVPMFFSTTADTATQTEKEQSGQIIRLYITAASTKLFSKIIWDELYGCWCCWTQGVTHQERGFVWCSTKEKKLGYYTYQLMVEILEGSDWDNIQTIQEKDGIYIYKFTPRLRSGQAKQGKPIWVAWNDNTAEKRVTISGITSSQVKITEAIPKYESGKEITDYRAAFSTETKSVENGKISITLGDTPVFIEEQ